jgi:hypothetical protein
MTFEGLGEMFEGYSTDTGAGKFPLVLMGGRAEGLACVDPGVEILLDSLLQERIRESVKKKVKLGTLSQVARHAPLSSEVGTYMRKNKPPIIYII